MLCPVVGCHVMLCPVVGCYVMLCRPDPHSYGHLNLSCQCFRNGSDTRLYLVLCLAGGQLASKGGGAHIPTTLLSNSLHTHSDCESIVHTSLRNSPSPTKLSWISSQLLFHCSQTQHACTSSMQHKSHNDLVLVLKHVGFTCPPPLACPALESVSTIWNPV